jgi:ssDNA-binding Zn-finger/Zn-ribbon topoisomerase 1
MTKKKPALPKGKDAKKRPVKGHVKNKKRSEPYDEHLGCMNWPNCDEVGCGPDDDTGHSD